MNALCLQYYDGEDREQLPTTAEKLLKYMETQDILSVEDDMIPVHTNLLAKYRPLPKENKITQAYEEQQKELQYGLHSTPTEEQ